HTVPLSLHDALPIYTWPYTDLTDQEMQTFLQMFRIYYDMVQVELVSWPHSELTPGRLATAWDCWIMYDWFAWIELNAKHLKKPIDRKSTRLNSSHVS